MQAYEFNTKVTSDGKLIIPNAYIPNMRMGDSVRVIVLVNEFPLSVSNPLEEQNLSHLEKVVTEIKATPQNPANIRPASGLLAKHLAGATEEFDSSLDVITWNEAWDKIEAEMESMEIADEQKDFHAVPGIRQEDWRTTPSL